MILLFKNVRGEGGGWTWDLTPILGFFKDDDVIVLVAVNS